MTHAVVLGVNGQDGSYAAEALLRRGYRVTGVALQPVSRYVPEQTDYAYRSLDLNDAAALSRLLSTLSPDEIYHLAAVHGPNSPAYEPDWQRMVRVNVLSLHAVLEHARIKNPELKIVYANSAKIFGNALGGRISEATPRVTTCLYGNTKNSAFDLIGHYRRHHGIAASNMILFNHESPRRPKGFFITDLVACLRAALADVEFTCTFRTLDFIANWGDAAEFMDMAVDLARLPVGRDLIFASPVMWNARDMVRTLFERNGLDYRRHIIESQPSRAPATSFEVDISALTEAISRRPERGIIEIAEDILGASEPCLAKEIS
jgi:GDPmannose 4,6-dehydratase